MNSSAIDIKDLHFSFDKTEILHKININFTKNKFYSIIGPNGSGKTTLLKNISKILKPTTKSIFLDNIDILDFKNSSLARKLAVVPQNTTIDFDFTALDIVLMGRSPYLSRFESESKKDYRLAKNAMNMTNTWQLRDKIINQLSGGEKQRVLIARALAQNTDIILMDEPISHLDLHHQIEILDTIKLLTKSITIVAVLHDLNLASQYSDYIILMDNGSIITSGTPDEVITEKNIKGVYKIDMCMIKNPINNRPHIIPFTSKKNTNKL
ncbi:ABC transporter ATP-binding protein [Clostridium fermenticellae]|uniref:ABC transporter ATP-binding protein n=1 Tax=Clostridium fermenticellae TaxID=2068654 RepID=A0A386H2Q4_9CLOT|nr:ABC transporter ATP-binding protein [Clostridium fermenticellae]AYD39950.1 ABC transporter ATP-binding protein [Clostridium fermenticellae]